MSIWQAVVLAIPVLIFIALLRLIRGTSRTDLRRPVRYFDASFILSIIATVAIFWVAIQSVASPEQEDALFPYMVAAMLVAVIAGIAFWIALGTLAFRLKRSPIVWVGLSFITSPIGPLVAYIWMRVLVSDALSEASASASDA